MARFNASFRQTGSFKASFADENDRFSSTFRTVVVVSDYEVYDGPYTVTPGDTEQVLETDGYLMTGNVTVAPIPSNYGRITWDGSVLTVS